MGLRPRTVPLDRLEKAILCIGAFTTIVMAALLVSTSVAATSAQHDLANYESKLTSSQNTATNLRQEIGELTSTSRMNRIAKEKGLTLIEGNIRTVD
ncbi:hypothetical protein FC23_GL000709 [Lactobacillus psittaci DSM 15354]|uniref:Cell division protein FtsL n=2 Tax=Lactobacillus psittaci TaxID=116089 RepID=A0A0R1SE49_9LACO|nr:hypothetical protein FC23_GL000709 [Lactobacillus psittaci DSM 15354]